jgi:hypothetical protein
MKNLKEAIELQIERKGLTKELIYSSIGMTNSGFWHALKKETFSVKKFDKLLNILKIEPNYIFEWELNGENNEQKIKNEPVSEVDFLRNQVKDLTLIIVELSKKVDK